MILVNAYNVIHGGGVNVVLNYLTFLLNNNEEMIVTLPDMPVYREFAKIYPQLNIIWFRADIFRFISKVFYQTHLLNKLVSDHNISKVYSLGNLAFKTQVPQAVLIHNAYIIMDDSEVWKRFSFFNRVYLKMMKNSMLNYMKFADVILIQTETIKKLLVIKTGYQDSRFVICPNIINEKELGDNIDTSLEFDGSVLKLLFLSKYYPHKNFESLGPLCEEIRRRKLNIQISLTLDPNNKNEKKILDSLREYPSIIKNIGSVRYSELKSVYADHHGIFLPTLLESFSSTYIEAMHFRKMIFTSKRDFAIEVCGDIPFYFDPLDCKDIISTFESLMKNPDLFKQRLGLYTKQLTKISSADFEAVNKRIFASI